MCTLPMFSVTFLDEKIDEHFEVLLWQCQGIQSRVCIGAPMAWQSGPPTNVHGRQMLQPNCNLHVRL